MTVKLFIILFIFLNMRCDGLVLKDNSIYLNKPELLRTENNDKWMVNFVSPGSNKYDSCQIMPIKRRIFISDSECIFPAMQKDHWIISIDFFHGSTKYVDMAFVQDKNIFYHGIFSSDYNPKLRKVAFLIADQPVFADWSRNLLLGTAQLAYDEVPGYNEENQIKKITFNISDTSYDKCFMPIFNGGRINFSCYSFTKATTTCIHTVTNYSSSHYENVLDFLLCHTKKNRENLVLIGILSKKYKPAALTGRNVIVHFENVDDMPENIFIKMKSWYAENPNYAVYPIYRYD